MNSWTSWQRNSLHQAYTALQQHLGPRHTAKPPQVSALDLMRQAHMEPDAWQETVFTSQARQQLWLCHRQAGKSTAVAALAWEEAANVPDSLTLLVSRTLRQSAELFRKVKMFQHASHMPVPLIRDTALSLETAHRSRIISLPAHPDTVVGYSAPSLVIIDEAARVTDELYYILRPMMAMSRGRLIALSTPWGKRGFFYDAWSGASLEHDQTLDLATVQALLAEIGMTVSEEELAQEPQEDFAWHRMQLAAPDNPRLSKRFLANERRTVPDLIFQSEWMCQFVDPEGSVFSYDDLERMLSDDVMPLWQHHPQEFSGLSDDLEPLFQGSL